jgi:hypothetical protein
MNKKLTYKKEEREATRNVKQLHQATPAEEFPRRSGVYDKGIK